MKKLVLIVIGLAAIGAVVVGMGALNKPATAPTTTNTPEAATATASVEITSSGFSPATLSVKKGTKVTWTNKDTKVHWVASNPHPVHTDLSDFDARKSIVANGTYAFIFTKTGTFNYHDHLNPSTTGNITVTE